jgi:DEAD/DEAH box helicase domain-containing protein
MIKRLVISYKTFFHHKPSQHIRFLFPDLKGRAILKLGRTSLDLKICTHCLKMLPLSSKTCGCGKTDFVEVLVPDSRYQDSKGHWFTRKHCPGCGTRQSLVVLGAQSASLSSALINQLFASPYNTDKKLIAFSDNVQDAAHRASFFGARTWKFNFRAAVQQYLLSDGNYHALVGLGSRTLQYWKNKFNDEIATVAMFLPSDLEYLNEVRESQSGKRTQFSEAFWDALTKRIDWEVFTEYSLDCRKGRTLEKSGCSVAHVNFNPEQKSLDELLIRLQNIDPDLKDTINHAELLQLTHGIIKRWIQNGAIEHPALGSYISNLGNPYLINKNSYWMKGFGDHSRTPSFAWRQIPGKDVQERLDAIQSRPDKATSWYAHWLVKHWGHKSPMLLNYFDELISTIFDFMENAGVIIKNEVEGTQLWMLDANNVNIECKVEHYRCNVCGHQVTVSSNETEIYKSLHCLKASCYGTYVAFESKDHYYGDLYSNGDLIRLIPSEHTALLERNERENVEIQFKAKPEDRSPWSPNLLSCTPTLELGIDIGDLSSVLLCSVPLEQASFLQRIGRAGRTDGNAMIATIAEGKPHDLYFWADPIEMLHGNVEPPGVFLDAIAVLERQLMAFCIDRWVYSDPMAAIPKNVSAMISNLKSKKESGFPCSFIAFVNKHSNEIGKDFITLLGNNVVPLTQADLREYLDKKFEYKMIDCIQLAERMRNSLISRRRQLDSDINKNSTDPAANQDLIDELKMERDALSDLIRRIDEKQCYKLLTDEGLIPNYAFPEAGVQLKSIVYKRERSASSNGTKSFKTVYEYERAAASAISDFAPGNYFYAHRRRVQIDQVDHNISPPESYRLCPECGYMELEIKGSTPAYCPQCECIQFGAQQQVQQLLRIRQVFATSGDRKSLVGDDTDSRDVRFFERAMLVGFRDSEILGAWQLDDRFFPFGFEVRRKVLLRELNFGPFSTQNGTIRIAGEEIAGEGFEICKSCGRVSIDGKPIEHTFHCLQSHPNNNQQYLTATFLFRDFEGEALRIFLPTLSQGAENDIKSFLAAFHLGLRLHYQGDVSHLKSTLQSEPVQGNDTLRKQFIVIYDCIPGGTGYLKQFMKDPMLLSTVLQKALDRMSACSCQYISGRDGCYRCLLAHRNSNEMDLISRKTAMELARKIVDSKFEFRKLDAGVSKIDLVQVLESELEKKFISTLKEYSEIPGMEYRVKIEAKALKQTNGYQLSVDDQQWIIEPQIVLDKEKGTSVTTRIDFLISHAERKDIKPIALSLDGWEFHHARMQTDTRQRLALHRTGKYHIWTLTWDDMADLLKPIQKNVGLLGTNNISAFQTYLSKRSMHSWQDISTKGSLRLLLKYLSEPSDEHWQYFTYGLILSNLVQDQNNGADWINSISKWMPKSHSGWNPIWQGIGCKKRDAINEYNGWIGRDLKQNAVILRINDNSIIRGDDKQYWENYWRTVNIFQFIPDFIFVTEQGANEGIYDDIPMSIAKDDVITIDPIWQELSEFCNDARITELLKIAFIEKLNAPVALHEIIDNDTIIAQTEIAWPEQMVGIVATIEDQKVLRTIGWKVQMISEINCKEMIGWIKG